MTAPVQETFGGVPAWLLTDYLVQLGGRRAEGDALVEGDGWAARLTQGVRRLNGLQIGRVTVQVEGPEAGRILELLRKKAMRGGG